MERALLGEYRELIETRARAASRPSTHDARRRPSRELPDVIRGYEDIKLANVKQFRAEVRALGV